MKRYKQLRMIVPLSSAQLKIMEENVRYLVHSLGNNTGNEEAGYYKSGNNLFQIF